MIERRIIPGTVEFRAAGEGGGVGTLLSRGIVFNQWSVDLGGFRERVAPSAVVETIEQDDIRCLFEHKPSLILGRNTAGTLRLSISDDGLNYETDLADTSVGRDVRVHVVRGDVTGSSFGFSVPADGDVWERREIDGVETVTRTLLKIRLFDIGPVVFPAYPQTDVQARDILEAARRRRALPDLTVGPRNLNLLRRRLELNAKRCSV
jgi:HK97 family phage prohead protease